MPEICSVVGARPQFVKAAAVRRALETEGLDEVLVHTGQHYDPEMSAVFFEEMGIREPDVNLEVGSGSHAVQTGEIMIRLEAYLRERPHSDALLVYGDTNSTIAAAIVGAKLGIPVAHVEAGLRSFNRNMPEEINRLVTDRLSDLLFCPTRTAVDNLANEGISSGVHLTGDVMHDATLAFSGVSSERRPLGSMTHHPPGSYFLATVHRAENTDDLDRLKGILAGLGRLERPVILPVHPRTQRRMQGISAPANVEVWQPASYLSMLTLVKNALKVFTDSGGLQKEALWLETPCATFRSETEWVETLERGWNLLVGADPDLIADAAGHVPEGDPPVFGEPGASARIASVLAGLANRP